MKQHIRIYRHHVKACIHGHTKPLFDGDRATPDCACVLNVTGYLRNELTADGKPKRIQHHSLRTHDWTDARRKREEFLAWGRLTAPATGLDALQGDRVTVEDAIKFFFECGSADGSMGNQTQIKYRQLLDKRLLPWCAQQTNPVRLIKQFDEPITVTTFFNSWRKRKNIDNNKVFETNDGIAPGTKRAMLERYRTFLGFCKNHGWLQRNYAKKLHVSTAGVEQKYAWTMEEYEHILETLAGWKDEHGRTGQPDAIRKEAFFLALRYTGQRISDVSMMGPDSLVQEKGNWFFSLTQIKTGSHVKVPVPQKLVDRLQSLPIRGELEQPYVLKSNRRSIKYGRQFWFWSGKSSPESNAKDWGQHLAAVLKQCEATYGNFEHHSSAHTARHFFAITMLNAGTNIEVVAKWLGHASSAVTSRHYSHANSDWHQDSHDTYMKALEAFEATAAS